MNRHSFYTTGLVILLLAIVGNAWLTLDTISRVRHDEQAVKRTAAHTRLIQQQGEPVGVCLLDAMKAVEPLLLKVPAVHAPLSAYVRLQSRRYTSVRCPD